MSTGLSYVLHEAIHMMEIMKEMNQLRFLITQSEVQIHCHAFEDNSRAIEMAKVCNFHPCTKHLIINLHHFHSYVECGKILIHPITKQLADYTTKPLNSELQWLCKDVMGW